MHLMANSDFRSRDREVFFEVNEKRTFCSPRTCFVEAISSRLRYFILETKGAGEEARGKVGPLVT